MKEISSGIIIINKNNQILACRPFGKNDGRFDIPKGHIENGETPYQAAIRETFEETGLDMSNIELIDLGLFKYIKNKDLYLFKCEYNIEDLSKLNCTTYFEIKGNKFPEVDSYEWINIEDVENKFYVKLGLILKKLLIKN